MTKLRLSDLPPKVRAQVERDLGQKPRPKKSRAGISDRVPCPGTCGICGEAFPSAHKWEQHCDATGHGIWSIDLPSTIHSDTSPLPGRLGGEIG